MSDDRLAQARAEAYLHRKRFDRSSDYGLGFMDGVAWADDNPQPRTITRSAFTRLDLVMRIHGIRAMLNDLGFKVVDDE